MTKDIEPLTPEGRALKIMNRLSNTHCPHTKPIKTRWASDCEVCCLAIMGRSLRRMYQMFEGHDQGSESGRRIREDAEFCREHEASLPGEQDPDGEVEEEKKEAE